jgi:hypothetical protein
LEFFSPQQRKTPHSVVQEKIDQDTISWPFSERCLQLFSKTNGWFLGAINPSHKFTPRNAEPSTDLRLGGLKVSLTNCESVCAPRWKCIKFNSWSSWIRFEWNWRKWSKIKTTEWAKNFNTAWNHDWLK